MTRFRFPAQAQAVETKSEFPVAGVGSAPLGKSAMWLALVVRQFSNLRCRDHFALWRYINSSEPGLMPSLANRAVTSLLAESPEAETCRIETSLRVPSLRLPVGRRPHTPSGE